MRNSPAGERFFKKSEIYQQKANLKTAEGQTVREKYELIDRTLESPSNNLSVSALCDTAGVSRSGFYSWKKRKSFISEKEEQDRKDFELILEAHKFKGYDKGRRGIHMRLLHMGILMNHKKISRLMKKYGLFCPIRKANPARRMAKAMKTSNYADNILNRHFEEYGPGYVLETDITYLFYGHKRSKVVLRQEKVPVKLRFLY